MRIHIYARGTYLHKLIHVCACVKGYPTCKRASKAKPGLLSFMFNSREHAEPAADDMSFRPVGTSRNAGMAAGAQMISYFAFMIHWFNHIPSISSGNGCIPTHLVNYYDCKNCCLQDQPDHHSLSHPLRSSPLNSPGPAALRVEFTHQALGGRFGGRLGPLAVQIIQRWHDIDIHMDEISIDKDFRVVISPMLD